MRSVVLIVVIACLGCGSASPSAPGAAPVTSATLRPERACDRDCEPRCNAGEIAACTRGAELFFDGKNGHALDMATSFRLARRACDAGDALGCVFAGYHYQDGLGTDWDPARAVTTYETACKAGAGTGCYNLSTMYGSGQGVEVDLARRDTYARQAAIAWEAACNGREPRWCTNAAFLKAGDGEPTAATKAAMRALDRRACGAKVLVGCVEATRLDIELGTMSAAAGVTELERLCTAGEPSGCAAAGATLLSSHDTSEPPRWLALIRRACDAGEGRSCRLIGLAYRDGEVLPKDPAEAARHLAMACDRADRSACAALAELHGERGELAQLVVLSRRACQMGHGEACAVLGSAYRRGEGVAANEAEALRWTNAGCQAGFRRACDILIGLDVKLPLPAEIQADLYRDACKHGVTTACARLHAN